ncbi:MAG: hypothetical protein U0800_22130 [Isosphaeraceae bacterium]
MSATRQYRRTLLIGIASIGIMSHASTPASAQRAARKPGGPGGQQLASPGPVGQPRGIWLGQDGTDKVGPSGRAEPSDVQDVHIRLDGLPPKAINRLTLKGLGGDEWNSQGQGGWLVLVERSRDLTRAELFFEPTREETGRGFEVIIDFADNSRVGFFLDGGKADPRMRVAGASVKGKWIGLTAEDRVGEGPGVGPDGRPDSAIALEKLSAKGDLPSVRIDGPDGLAWESGLNPEGRNNAEVLRDRNDPTRATVYFQVPSNLVQGLLQVSVRYAPDRTDSTSVEIPKKADRAEAATKVPALPSFANIKAEAHWLGQDGKGSPGDVHVSIRKLPTTRAVAAVALSNSSRAGWTWRRDDKVRGFEQDPLAQPLEVRRGTSAGSIDLFFPPDRDETDTTLHARVHFDDGSMTLVAIPGGKADIAARSPAVETRTANARPGEDLHRLAENSGTIRLAKGVYELDRPLILPRAVRLIGEPGTVLRFSQKDGSPAWTAAIKIHAGNTRLEGFAVRFGGPIRWRTDVDFEPAVIGTTDNHDDGFHDPKAGIALVGLDLESPAPKSPEGREEAIALARLVRSAGGRIERCTLRGGMIRFTKGPWEIVDNTHKGTAPGSFTWAVFSCFNSHDLLLKGNKALAEGASGKTWRFLVQTVSGIRDVVEENSIEGIGPRDTDSYTENAPEIILTEAYRVHFEGKPSDISKDRRIVRIPKPQGDTPRTGDILAVVGGKGAGNWSRVVQAIDPRTFVVDPPLPEGADVISITTGFVDETYRRNKIDSRGGTVACNMVLVGNHFGLKVIDNRLMGAGAFKITAAPSEHPHHWGWSHVACLGATIAGNTLEDQQQPALLAVEREGPVKSSKGRVYLTATFKDNVLAWSSSSPKGIKGIEQGIGVKLNDAPTLDPGEARIDASGNVARGAPASIQILGATLNGEALKDRTIELPDSPSSR